MTDLVRMTSIDKSFPGVRALVNAQFDLRAGEVHALMGENGAGKSTLMKVLAGIYKADAGDILIDGQSLDIGSPAKARDAGIGIIHQELNLMPHLTAAQNILIGREPRTAFGLLLDEPALNARVAELFNAMHLNLDPATPVEGLTIAKQQMVEIVKALSYRSRILIMDEPTAALNDAEVGDLFEIIRRLKSEGVGIVYISHKMDEIKRVADRVTVMRDGAFVGTVDAKETPISKIISMMVGRELTNEASVVPDLSANPIVLEVDGLNCGALVRNISFTLKQGEILGFAGLMGAGRTEVARVIFGADPKESGEIRIRGRTVPINSPQDAVAAGIGYLSEDRKQFGLIVGMDVRNNIAMASIPKFIGPLGMLDESGMRDAARDHIARLAIKTPSERQETRLLSGGNQQKVVIAKWLLRDCDVLIFDEPTRGIDVGAKSDIYRLLNELAAQGKAIIVISSELPEILRLSHRIAVMCEGRLTGILPARSSQEQIMQLATRLGDEPTTRVMQ
ncbi:MAG TPA: sugar ABC transporter ATP-binding protein [Rhizobiaceae bacterium]|nr:sugar ABC transporter ATP-binding protein [Rhizobiaceae bacterium]